MPRGSQTFISDPGWNYRYLDAMNALLEAFVKRRQMDKERRERQTMESLDTAMTAVSSGKADPRDPNIARVLDAARRYNPQLADVARGIFDASAGRLDTAKKAEGAYNTLVQRTEEEQRAMELLQLLGGRPGMAGMMGSSSTAIGEAMSGQPLGAKLQRAMQGMPVGQQLLALPQLKDAGVDMNVAAPTAFDPYKHLPPNLAALQAAGEGKVGADVAQGARYATNLERTPQGLAAEALQKSQQDLGERRLRLQQRREARLARGGGAGGGEKEARAEAKERQGLIDAAAQGIRQNVLDQRTMAKDAAPQGAKPKASALPPIPNFRDARREAVRQEAAALSPRLQGALEAVDAVKAQMKEQLSTAGALEVASKAGRSVPNAQARLAVNERLRQALPAIEKAENAALDLVAAGKDPDVVAGYIEELLSQLQ